MRSQIRGFSGPANRDRLDFDDHFKPGQVRASTFGHGGNAARFKIISYIRVAKNDLRVRIVHGPLFVFFYPTAEGQVSSPLPIGGIELVPTRIHSVKEKV